MAVDATKNMDVATSKSRARRESQLAEQIDGTETSITQAASVHADLLQQIAFQQRQLAFQQRIASLTRSRIHSQVQSTSVLAHTRRQSAKAADLLGTSNESQAKTANLQAALGSELDRRARHANIRLEQMKQQQRRLELEITRQGGELRSRKQIAANVEAALDERRANAQSLLAREQRRLRREQQARRRHFAELLASANEVLEFEVRRGPESVKPSPRHAVDAEQAYDAACTLKVPVELWPEFCLTVLVGGLDAARSPPLPVPAKRR